ncbi:hypothetical protein HNR30_009285 [Nonomuraea soli]|uniref:Uncharacterized protein n=1 Tax=Nonomuraea soli TaxID=1032476 RepID=A0A7W0HW40_9ACTN|nr:hypothetical protein [Nonomuraea soli]
MSNQGDSGITAAATGSPLSRAFSIVSTPSPPPAARR